MHAIPIGQRARAVNSRDIREGDRRCVERRVRTIDVRGNSRTRGRGVVALHRDRLEDCVEVAWPIVSLGKQTQLVQRTG